MPRKPKTTVVKTTKKTYKKRNYKKKPALTNGSALTMIKQTPFLGVSHWSRNMPYHEVILLSVAATPETCSAYAFSLNGMYDTDIPAIGHQPMGFDQAMLFYEHYTVTHAKWTIQYTCGDITPTQDTSTAVGYTISPDFVLPLSADGMVENGLMKRKIGTVNVTNPKCFGTLSGSLDMNKYFGKKIIDENDFRGEVNKNPLEQVYLVLFGNPLVSPNSFVITFDVTIDFTVKFTEPRKLAQS